jgi:hypothetical protein
VTDEVLRVWCALCTLYKVRALSLQLYTFVAWVHMF